MIVKKLLFVTVCTIFVVPGVPDYPKAFYKSPFSAIRNRAVAQTGTSFEITSRLKVVGGEEAEPHQFPYQVSIQVRNYFGGYDHNCGGVIYDANHVITAAHCLRGYHPNNIKIVAGEHELFNDEGAEQYRDLLGYSFHPGFDPDSLDNDIGIITLDYPLDLNDKVQPIKIPAEFTELPKAAQTSGWGSDGSSNDFQPKLRFVNLKTFSQEECAEAYKGVGEITDGMLCAGDEQGGKGSCHGDSGGPLICKERGDNGAEYLCGLVSWGMSICALPQFPSVFTNINSYLDWLHGLLPPQEL